MEIGQLEQIIVKDLKDHKGLSVDTIIKIGYNTDYIIDFKILASIIKHEFEGINGDYKEKSLEAPVTSRLERSNKKRKSGLTSQTSPKIAQSKAYVSKQQIDQYRKNAARQYARVNRSPKTPKKTEKYKRSNNVKKGIPIVDI